MAKNNINNNNQASKFGNLLGGLKAETKPSLSDLLDKSETKGNPDQNINVSNDDEQNNKSGELNLSDDEQKEKSDVVDGISGLNPGEKDQPGSLAQKAESVQNPVKSKTGKSGVGEGLKAKKTTNTNVDLKPKKDNKNVEATDYDRFLQKSRSAKTKSIFINEDYDTLIGKIVNQIGEGLTKAAYLENILDWHFETYGTEIKKRRKAALEKQNNDL